MTIEEAKTELKQIEAIRNRIIDRKRRLAELQADFGNIKIAKYDGVFVGASKQDQCRLEENIDRREKLEKQISDDLLNLYELQQAITWKIEQLPHPFSTVLTKRFVHRESYERIAVDMSYSYYHVANYIVPVGIKKYAKVSEK